MRLILIRWLVFMRWLKSSPNNYRSETKSQPTAAATPTSAIGIVLKRKAEPSDNVKKKAKKKKQSDKESNKVLELISPSVSKYYST